MKNYARKIGNRKGLITFRTQATYRIRKHLAVTGIKSRHKTSGTKFQTPGLFPHRTIP